jgi:hypothetical protein
MYARTQQKNVPAPQNLASDRGGTVCGFMLHKLYKGKTFQDISPRANFEDSVCNMT